MDSEVSMEFLAMAEMHGHKADAPSATPESVLGYKTSDLIAAGRLLQGFCYAASKAGGWHNDIHTGAPRTLEQNDEMFPLRIALCHSELSEALEGHRKTLMDDKLPHRKMPEVELADALIREFDLGASLYYDLGGALVEKVIYNLKRLDHKPDSRKKAGGKAY